MSTAKARKVPKLRFRGFSGEWQAKKLGELLSYEQPTKYIVESTEYADQYKIPVLTAGKTFVLGYTSETQGIFSQDLPVIIFDDFTTASQFVDFPFKVKSSAMKILKAKPGAEIKIAYELLKGINFEADDHKRYWIGEFQDFSVLVPGKDEQKKIAGFLMAVDDKVSALQNKKEQLEKYKKGVMRSIFYQKIRLKEFSDKWQSATLGDIGRTYNGLQGKAAEDFGEGKSYITYNQIFASSSLDVETFGKVEVTSNEKQNTAKKGDIFFTTSSETPEEVGYASVLLHDIEPLYLNSFCFGYRITKLDKLLPEFAQFLFRDQSFRKKVVRLAQGSTRYNLSKTELMKVEVKLPEIAEQKSIANYLTSLDDKIDLTERQLEQAKLFKKALLQQMFV